jgi:hypothetical protein
LRSLRYKLLNFMLLGLVASPWPLPCAEAQEAGGTAPIPSAGVIRRQPGAPSFRPGRVLEFPASQLRRQNPESLPPVTSELVEAVLDAVPDPAATRTLRSGLARGLRWGTRHGLVPTAVVLQVSGDASFIGGAQAGLELAFFVSPESPAGDRVSIGIYRTLGVELGAGASLSASLGAGVVFNLKDIDDYPGCSLGIEGDLAAAVGIQGFAEINCSKDDFHRLASFMRRTFRMSPAPRAEALSSVWNSSRQISIGASLSTGASAKVTARLEHTKLIGMSRSPIRSLRETVARILRRHSPSH